MGIGSTKLLAGVLWVCTLLISAKNAPAQEQEPFSAPILPLNVKSMEGQSIRADAAGGRLVILDFFTSWCVPCQTESRKLQAVQHRLGPDKVEVIGVDVKEDSKRAAEFVSETKVTFPVLLDDGTLQKQYRVYMYPLVLVFDRQTHLLYRFKGEDNNLSTFVAGLVQH